MRYSRVFDAATELGVWSGSGRYRASPELPGIAQESRSDISLVTNGHGDRHGRLGGKALRITIGKLNGGVWCVW